MGTGDPENPVWRRGLGQAIWANNLQDRQTDIFFHLWSLCRAGELGARDPLGQGEQEGGGRLPAEVPTKPNCPGTERPGDSPDGPLPRGRSPSPEPAARLPAHKVPHPARCPPGRAMLCLYIDGVFPIQLVRDELCEPSVTCSCLQGRLGRGAGLTLPPPTRRPGLPGLSPLHTSHPTRGSMDGA